MVKEITDIRPVLVKLGVVLALSFAGFLYTRLRNRRTKSSKPPYFPCPSVDVGGVNEEGERAGIASGKHEFDLPDTRAGKFSEVETTPAARPVENDDHEQEIRHWKETVCMLQEREKNLESKLLEFYGLKEQATALTELQNRLNASNGQIKLLAWKIDSLQADNQRLQAQVDDYANLVAELDAARTEINFLRKRVKSEAEYNREQILTLQKRVTKLQKEELKAVAVDSDIQLKLKRLKDLEAETEDLRKSNLRLASENSELARQLESTQIPANSDPEDPRAEALRELQNKLKQENEHLAKEVELLQADRYKNSEELVYLRWINACLRYELRNFQPGNGITVARDLSKSLSPKSEEKAKQLILEYANSEELWETGIDIVDFEPDRWSSSHTSYVVDSGDLDDSVNSPKSRNSRKVKIFNKLRRLIRGKDTTNVTSVNQIGRSEDSESSCGSSGLSTATDGATDGQYTRIQSLSLDLSRRFSGHSADIQGVKNPRMYGTKHMKIGRSNSDLGFSYGHRRFSSGRVTTSHSPENQLERGCLFAEKSELLKFAEVLKYPGNKTRTFHKKSAALGSSEAFQRTIS